MALRAAATLLLALSVVGASPIVPQNPEAKFCPSAAKHLPKFYDDALPDPFHFNDGTPVTSVAEWGCRRGQIMEVLQSYELGTKPGKPPRFSHSFVPGANSSIPGNLTINAGKGDAEISFSVSITYPPSGVGSAPYPAIIVYDGASIPIPEEVAVIVFNVDQIAQQNDQSSRGVGLFYELYGTNATAGALMAWAWAVSRIIDALEDAPAAKIATGKMAVTGCSRNGKGAMVAGAFEPRLALTIPQESGSGGDTCWRLSKYEQDSGDVVQQATEIVQENVWFSPLFDQYVYNISVLPYDHHMLAGLIAPRALFSTENTVYEWLSPLSAFGCMTAAHRIWQALKVPGAHSFNQDGNHSHCLFPTDQEPALSAFFSKFLLDKQAQTNLGIVSNHEFNGTEWQAKRWIDWSTPSLD